MRRLVILQSFVNRFNQKVILYYSMHYRLPYGLVISAVFVFKVGGVCTGVATPNCLVRLCALIDPNEAWDI